MEDQLNSCSQTDSEYDPYVEHLRRKYLQSTVCTEGSTALSSNSNGVLNDDCPANFMECSPSSSLTASEKQHYQQAMNDLRRLLQKGVKPDTSPQKQEFDENETDNITPVQDKDTGYSGLDHTLINSTTLPTLPSDITGTTAQNYTGKSQKSVRISLDPTMLNEHDLFEPRSILRSHKPATDVRVIHNELINIHKKLNVKSQRLAEERAVLEEREHELEMREESVRMREDALAEEEASVRREHEVMIRLQGVESEVQEKFEILREHHSDEMNRVSAALTDKLKDMKRLKNSFDIIKTQNDDIKQQVCELTEQNKKLTSQNIKLKKRCENLQRKNDYNAQKKNTVLSEQQNKRTEENSFVQIQSKPISQEKSPKVLSSCLEALSVTLQWVCTAQLRHLVNTAEPRVLHISKENVGDNCLKVLPLLVEVVRHLPSFTSQPKHQLPYIRFIYWALHHLEDTHHALLSSTARRLGEELMRSSPSKQVMEMSSASNSTLQSSIGGEGKTRMNSFFRSSNHEVRMLSSLIILKTLHQVDMLAQVYDQLKQDLKDERCRETFLEYSATHAILPFMTYKTNKALVGSAVDVMLQMAMESPLLPSFLDLCSCEPWFRAVASCLRSTTTEQCTLEKLSIILQKLSKIKSNKKLFDSFSLGRLLQDKHRECDPDNTFLSLNLRSILFNLNLIKSV